MSNEGHLHTDGLVVDVAELESAVSSRDVYVHRLKLNEVRIVTSWPGIRHQLKRSNFHLNLD